MHNRELKNHLKVISIFHALVLTCLLVVVFYCLTLAQVYLTTYGNALVESLVQFEPVHQVINHQYR
jgi:hypothetical protein